MGEVRNVSTRPAGPPLPDPDLTTAAPAANRRHRLGVAALTLAAAILYAICSFHQYYTFNTSTYDLVIFDQGIRSYSHFHLPVAIVKGVHNALGTHITILGDHFSPVLALIAPFYWLHDGPQTLLVAQAVLFAAAVPPLWVFTRRELTAGAAYLVAAGYALCWPIAQALAFDFHEVAFVPLGTALLFERFSALRRGNGRWWQVALAALFLLTIKEDTGLLVVGFGLAILAISLRPVPHRRDIRLLGLAFTAGGLAVTYVASRVLVLAFGGGAEYDWRYSHFGASVPQAAEHVAAHPLDAVRTFFQPDIKVHTMLLLLAIAALAPLVSPYLLVALPLLAERMLGSAPAWWGTDYHYNAFIVVALFCAGVDGAARVQRWVTPRLDGLAPRLDGLGPRWGGLGPRLRALGPWVGLVWAAAVLLVAVIAVPSFAFGPLVKPSSWRHTPQLRAAEAAVARVPSGVVVEAVNNLGPQLSGRSTVLLWDRLPRFAPWVVADIQRPAFPFCGLAAQQQRVTLLERDGYQVVFQQDGYLVLHHPGPLPAITAAPSPACA